MPASQREGFHVSFASIAGVHGPSWPSASTRSPAAPWDPRLPPLRPTARLSASSERCSQDGPMVRSTATATSAPPPLTAGSGTTTVSADTQPSATSPRSLALTREEPTRDLHLGPVAALTSRQCLRIGPHGKTTSEAMGGGRLHDPAE